jgi:hypothetical protein
MGDWSGALSKHLASQGPRLLDLIDLRNVTDGQEFEHRLGAFLQQVQGFNASKPLLESTGALPGMPAPLIGSQSLKEWCEAAAHSLNTAIKLIHESLVEEFAKRSCNLATGRSVYSTLLEALGIGLTKKKKWVYATTNYDRNAEKILSDLGFKPDAGADFQ